MTIIFHQVANNGGPGRNLCGLRVLLLMMVAMNIRALPLLFNKKLSCYNVFHTQVLTVLYNFKNSNGCSHPPTFQSLFQSVFRRIVCCRIVQ
jgi:hypothetical protein